MKQKKTTLFLIFLGLGVILGTAGEIVEEIVAIINDDVITLTQYKREYEMRLQALQAQIQQAQAQGQVSQEEIDRATTQLKTGLLDALTTDILLLQLAKEKNLNVTDQVRMAVENIKKENNLESDDDLKRALKSQGMEWEVWLKQLEENTLRQAVLYTEVNRSIVLDDAEVVDHYKKRQPEFIEPEEYKIRAVYLSLEGKSEAELEDKKKEIDKKVKAGEDFLTVSETSSDAPLKESKGDLGTFKKSELDKTLLAAVENLKKGDISAWARTKNGWYLLKLEDKKGSRLKAFDEVKKTIEEKIFMERQNAKMIEFLNNLKKKSYIKILKPNPLNF
jgi:parvulin-like peptidyl-prolyl isomerase